MMDERRIEALLRDAPPDEPKYRGEVAASLRARASVERHAEPTPHMVEVTGPPTRRGPRALSWSVGLAAAIALVLGLSVVGLRHEQRQEATPTTPASTTGSSPLPVLQADQIVGRWVGPTPVSVATPSPLAPSFVVFTQRSVALNYLSGGVVSDFNSSFTLTQRAHLHLTLTDQRGKCQPGATGDYQVTLSPHATSLTLTPISDMCPARAAALAGVRTRVGCPTRGNDCLGALEEGRHESVNFDPFDTNAYGEVSYSVPDGWASPLDDKSQLTLVPPGPAATNRHGVYFLANVASAKNDCSSSPGDASGTAALAAALAALPGLSVTSSEQLIGTNRARVLDVTAAETLTCGTEQTLLVSKPESPTKYALAIGSGQRARIWLIDLGEGRTMAVVVTSDQAAAPYKELLDASAPVIDSLVLSATSEHSR